MKGGQCGKICVLKQNGICLQLAELRVSFQPVEFFLKPTFIDIELMQVLDVCT